MRLNVNPNRMELIKLRRRLVLARRGHKLLKDKRDELMRIFMEMFERVFKEREALDAMFASLMAAFRVRLGDRVLGSGGKILDVDQIAFEFARA